MLCHFVMLKEHTAFYKFQTRQKLTSFQNCKYFPLLTPLQVTVSQQGEYITSEIIKSFHEIHRPGI